jgi:L-lactate dehydrogenase complex protein LldE
MKADLFIPCFIDQYFPETAWNTVKVLEKAGIEINYNPRSTCCGQPSYNSGYLKPSIQLARKFVKEFKNDRPLIVPSASCTGYIKQHYTEVLADESAYKNDCERITKNVVELSDFLVNHLQCTQLEAVFPHTITYHDGCSALREYGIKEEPRKLLQAVRDLELVEMAETDTCCGFGGTFMVKFTPISTAMVQNKVEHALATGAEYIVSTEASCLINIDSYVRKQKLPIKTAHIVDVLACF